MNTERRVTRQRAAALIWWAGCLYLLMVGVLG